MTPLRMFCNIIIIHNLKKDGISSRYVSRTVRVLYSLIDTNLTHLFDCSFSNFSVFALSYMSSLITGMFGDGNWSGERFALTAGGILVILQILVIAYSSHALNNYVSGEGSSSSVVQSSTGDRAPPPSGYSPLTSVPAFLHLFQDTSDVVRSYHLIIIYSVPVVAAATTDNIQYLDIKLLRGEDASNLVADIKYDRVNRVIIDGTVAKAELLHDHDNHSYDKSGDTKKIRATLRLTDLYASPHASSSYSRSSSSPGVFPFPLSSSSISIVLPANSSESAPAPSKIQMFAYREDK